MAALKKKIILGLIESKIFTAFQEQAKSFILNSGTDFVCHAFLSALLHLHTIIFALRLEYSRRRRQLKYCSINASCLVGHCGSTCTLMVEIRLIVKSTSHK